MKKRINFEYDPDIVYPVEFSDREIRYYSAILCDLEFQYNAKVFDHYELKQLGRMHLTMSYFIDVALRYLHSRINLQNNIETKFAIITFAYYLKRQNIDKIEFEDVLEKLEDALTWYVRINENNYFKTSTIRKFKHFRDQIDLKKNINEILMYE